MWVTVVDSQSSAGLQRLISWTCSIHWITNLQANIMKLRLLFGAQLVQLLLGKMNSFGVLGNSFCEYVLFFLNFPQARVQNVPYSPLLKSSRSQAWVHINASTIVFLPGGPMYPRGAESYLSHLTQLVPELGIGTTTRVALDLECGTGSLSLVLGMRQVTTLCLSAYDSPENGVRLVMERGFPGLLTHSLDSSGSPQQRLPFPSQAFDLLHCAACNISWTSNDGTLLFEADRILRNGGFFVWFMDVSNQGVAGSGS